MARGRPTAETSPASSDVPLLNIGANRGLMLRARTGVLPGLAWLARRQLFQPPSSCRHAWLVAPLGSFDAGTTTYVMGLTCSRPYSRPRGL